jgi:metal-responsive CopG/Arc/MetJ family transcriptional regulator
MAKSTAKKRMGRPRTGERPNILTRIDHETLDTIDKLAKQQGVSRAEIIRQLIAEALDARRKR